MLGDGSVQPREDVSRPSGVTQPPEDLPVVRAVTSGQQGDGPFDVAVVVGQFQQNAADPVLANDVLLGLARI